MAVGASGENGARGSLTVLYGSPAGVTVTGAQYFTENSLFGAGAGESGEEFGSALASGDFNADGFADLVAGVPGELIAGRAMGSVAVLYGGPGGAATTGSGVVLIGQGTAGVPGGPEANDRFGFSVASGDFNRNGVDELVVGVPGESGSRGVVQVLILGGPLGVLAGWSYSQNTPGVPGAAEADDNFGFSLAAGDITGDARDELAVGAIGENSGAGAVSLLRGSDSGLTGAGAQIFSQDTPGVAGASEDGDSFGYSLAIGRLDQGLFNDLAIGVPDEALGAVQEAGAVNILAGTRTGLTSAGAGQLLSQNTAGMPGAVGFKDGFGSTLAAKRIVDTTNNHNLLIGVPLDADRGARQDQSTN